MLGNIDKEGKKMYTVYRFVRYMDGWGGIEEVVETTSDWAKAQEIFAREERALCNRATLGGRSFFRYDCGTPTLIQGGYETTLHIRQD